MAGQNTNRFSASAASPGMTGSISLANGRGAIQWSPHWPGDGGDDRLGRARVPSLLLLTEQLVERSPNVVRSSSTMGG